MATGKVIGKIEVSSIGKVEIISADGSVRDAIYGDFVYEGEQIVSNDPKTLFQIKYLALPEASVYEGVFGVLADGSVVEDVSELETLFGDNIDFMDTAAGEREVQANSGVAEDPGIVAESHVQEFNRGEDTELGKGITDSGSNRFESNTDAILDQAPPVIMTTNVAVFDENSTDDILKIEALDSSRVTYSLKDGLDSHLLNIDPNTGVLRFNDAPDYENPQDLGGDNEYNVEVVVTDAMGNYTTQFVSVNVNNVNDAPTAIDDGINNWGDETIGATSGVTVTGIYRNGSDENILDGVHDSLVTSKDHYYFEHSAFGHTGYNYMGGHHWFIDHGISLSNLKGGVITFSDGTVGVIDAASNGAGSAESAYIYYNAADNITVGQSYYETTEDRSLRIDVLANDSDDEGDTLTLVDVQNPVLDSNGVVIGSATISGSTVLFTPNAQMDKLGVGEHEDISFTYTVSDGNSTSDATVNIKVMGTNDGPVVTGDIDLGTIVEDSSIDFTQAQLLANSSDIDTNDVLSVNSLSSSNGNIVDNGDGTFTFTPNENFSGDLEISFNVSDGHTNVATKATLSVTEINDAPVAVDDGKVDGTIDTSADFGDYISGATSSVTVTGIYAHGSDVNVLDGINDPLVTTTAHNYFEHHSLGHTGYNYMGGHDWFSEHGVSFSGLRGGIITFSDGTVGIIDATSNGSGDTESAYVYYRSYENLDLATNNLDAYLDVTQDHAHLNVGSEADFDFTTAFTISQNVTFNNGSNGGIIFNKEHAYELAVDSNGSVRYALSEASGTHTWIWNDTGYDLPKGEEHHISFSYDGANQTVKLYVDGVEVFSGDQNVPSALANTNADLRFGERGSNHQPFEGQIDDIQIHSTTLSGAEIATIANGGVVSGDLVASYDFNGANPLEDTSGNGHTATLVSGAEVVVTGVGNEQHPFVTDEGTTLTISKDIILSNDYDVDGDSLDINLTGSSTQHGGSVSLDGVGNIVYTPDNNYNGEDSFSYKVSDGHGGTDTATITVNVHDVINGTDMDDRITYDINDTIDGLGGTDTLVISDGNTFDLSNVEFVKNIEVIELGDNASITDATNGISTQDIIDITGTNELIINSTNDNGGIVNIDTAEFSKDDALSNSTAGYDVYTATDNGTTYTIQIDDTITVD